MKLTSMQKMLAVIVGMALILVAVVVLLILPKSGELSTLETDLRNVQLNEQLGFKVEGILRNECWFDGAYHDILRMALLVE